MFGAERLRVKVKCVNWDAGWVSDTRAIVYIDNGSGSRYGRGRIVYCATWEEAMDVANGFAKVIRRAAMTS